MNTLSLYGFGNVIATPTFRSTPTSDWSCNDWMVWHKSLVAAFMAGSFASGIKYTHEKATELANSVFTTHWDRSASFSNSNFCGYNSDFFNYFKNVGLGDILSYFQAIFTPAAEAATNVVSSGSKVVTVVAESGSNTVQNVAKAAENTAGVTKWLVPALVIAAAAGVVLYGYNTYVKPKQSLRGTSKSKL